MSEHTNPLNPGRSCPSHYYYGAKAINEQKTIDAETLYIVGGLYGNPQALSTIIEMSQQEPHPTRIVFNGDFNWFNIDDRSFCETNQTILQQFDATQGNVEAELIATENDAGCGCAYPEDVDHATVMRSNKIHSLLKQTAQRHPQIIDQITNYPLFLKYKIGKYQIAVVHGDSESLAGWRFAQNSLRNPANDLWLQTQFEQANVDIFASSHTCLPALKIINTASTSCCVINNGSAGMPNFSQTQYGLISRVSTSPSPTSTLYGYKIGDLYVDALPIYFDAQKWLTQFRANWPIGSEADISYAHRIQHGPCYTPEKSIIYSI